MRRTPLIILLTTLLLITYTLHRASTLIRLLFEDGSPDLIPASSLLLLQNTTTPEPDQLIPKIIHQTYTTRATIPTPWLAAQQSCLSLHPDYEYMFWNDSSADAFIATTYPWFLPTFRAYAHPIQRADAIRYFALAHYGGVYLDLDNGCRRRLDPLRRYPAWLHLTAPSGVSNDAMGAVPGHPFFVFVVAELMRYDRAWGAPYVTVMASTGPLFLSVLWLRYRDMLQRGEGMGRVAILQRGEYEGESWAFFQRYHGSSWHGADVRVMAWVVRHWILAVGVLALGVVAVVLGARWLGGRVAVVRRSRKDRFPDRVSSRSEQGRPGSSGWRFWERWSEGRKGRPVYELLDRRRT